MLPYGPQLSSRALRGRSLNDYSSLRICFPGLFAGHKDNRRVPKADGEIAVRATPEPPRLPTKGRRIGRQCQRRGSGPVVLVGVTPHQGDRESRPQGEGVYRPTVPRTTVTGSNMLHHGAICDQRHQGNGTLAQTGSSEPDNALSKTLGENNPRRMAKPSLGRDTAQQRKSDAWDR